eukprot:768245-Hanusia_phi.AAC.6
MVVCECTGGSTKSQPSPAAAWLSLAELGCRSRLRSLTWCRCCMKVPATVGACVGVGDERLGRSAHRSGLIKPGDVLAAIDGLPTKSMA